MVRSLISASLRFRALVLTAALALLVIGGLQLRSADLDTYPQFTPPLVQIQTEALGLSGQEVEQLITVPLEDQLNGVAWLDTIRSKSIPGLSSIDMVFERGTNVLRARQLVQERMSQLRLPGLGATPTMLQPTSSTSRLLMIGLVSKTVSLTDLSVLARWKIRPRLMGVPGVANVSIWGQRDRRLQVEVDPRRLRRAGVTVDQVMRSTGNALWVSPLSYIQASTPGTGGFLDTPTQRFAVQHILPITTANGLSSVTIEGTGNRHVRLSDVTNVVEDHQPLIGDAVVNNKPSLLLVLEKFPDANTLAVTKAVDAVLDNMKPGLSGITVSPNLYRPATYVSSSMHNLMRSALIGSVLLLLLLTAFYSWRVALVGYVAIGLSLLVAALVLTMRGASINAMTVAGLAMAVGAVVDDAVSDLDTIARRLRRHRSGGETTPAAAVVLQATLTMRRSMLFAALIGVLAVLPLLSLSGVTGSFARPLVVSYALAVAASMLVALILLPALALTLLPSARTGRRPLPRRLQRWYDRGVAPYLFRPLWAFAAVGVLALSGLAVTPFLHGAALPALQDRSLLVHWQAAPGTSLPEMDRITEAAGRQLRTVPGVATVGAHVGRALTSDQVSDVDSAELWVTLAGAANYDRTLNAVRRVADSYPGIRHQVLTYPRDRVQAAANGTQDDLVVRVYGDDLSTLQAKANEVRRLLGSVRGVERPTVENTVTAPAMEVEVRLAAAARYGIKPGDVRRAAATLLSGTLVGNLYEQQKIFDVVVWGTPAVRHSETGVENLLIDTPSGGVVPLHDVATVHIRPNPTVIRHDATSRSLDVTASVHGRSQASVAADVRSRVRALPMPLEYHAEVLGDAAAEQTTHRRTALFALAAGVGALLLLQSAFASWRRAALLLVSLPLSLVGGVLAIAVVGANGSLGGWLALLAVLSLAVRQGVALFAAYAHLENQPGRQSPADIVRRGTRARVAPIVLSSLGVAALFVPFAVSGDIAGLEILHPMAIAVLGGLVTSTVVTALVLPGLYLRLAGLGGQTGPHSTEQPDRPLTTVR